MSTDVPQPANDAAADDGPLEGSSPIEDRPPSELLALATSAIELQGIDKRFGTIHANRAVDLKIGRATIHGIVGENGAGKSTLMKILYGYYKADRGRILVGGREAKIASPSQAIKAGIGMVHQHFMLVDNFTVLENLMLGAEGAFWLKGSFSSARNVLSQVSWEYGLEVEPDAIVGDLPVGLQQRVEILKILFRGAEVVVLDEPTAVLTPQETQELFKILRRLKAEGKTVVLITHKLQEVMEVTDHVTVMRDGAVAGSLVTAETNKRELAELMVGRRVVLRVEKGKSSPGRPCLEVDQLTVRDSSGQARVEDITFGVREGEIVGIAGVSGNGQSELMEALAGMRPIETGSIRLRGQVVALPNAELNPGAVRALGVTHVPEDRLKSGLVTSFDAAESAILGYQGDRAYNGPVLADRAKIVSHCAQLMSRFDVRPPEPLLRSGAFSGGNQQKLVLAREIEREPILLLVGQPTRGVDVGAIEFIHQRLVELRDEGKAILLVSAELDEILSLADRIVVMFEGKIVGELTADEATPKKIGLMMAGVVGNGS